MSFSLYKIIFWAIPLIVALVLKMLLSSDEQVDDWYKKFEYVFVSLGVLVIVGLIILTVYLS